MTPLYAAFAGLNAMFLVVDLAHDDYGWALVAAAGLVICLIGLRWSKEGRR